MCCSFLTINSALSASTFLVFMLTLYIFWARIKIVVVVVVDRRFQSNAIVGVYLDLLKMFRYLFECY